MLPLLAALPAAWAGPAPDEFASAVRPVLEEHCLDCHGTDEPSGGIDLERLAAGGASRAAPEVWSRVRAALAAGAMPPPDVEPRPARAEVEAVLGWIAATAPSRPPAREAGSTTLRRLNRRELEHAVLDLLGVALDAGALLPADGVGAGFDVVGETLTLSPFRLEGLLEAAEAVARAALPPAAKRLDERRVPAADLETDQGNRHDAALGRVVLSSNGRTSARFDVARPGTHRVRVQAAERHAGPEAARLELEVDGVVAAAIEVAAPLEAPAVYEARVRLETGAHTVSAAFVNDYYRPEAEDPAERDRNLHVWWIQLAGPEEEPLRTPFEARFRPRERSLAEVVPELARLVWRGSATAADVGALLELAAAEETPDEGLRVALTALLVSPRFLFRPEPPPAGDAAWRELESRELATRLAAYLWSSVPDQRLLDAGEALLEPGGLRAEAARMLRDARASRLARGFASQWLQLGRLADASPDPALFPGFDDELRQAMRLEAERFFEAVLREGRPVSELLCADFTFANERLARHYGLPGVRGPELRRVAVPGHLARRRGGLLGQAAVLTATSNPTRTSAVLRGKWVLEALLDTPPSPPPPGVGALDESPGAARSASLRERLEAHRAEPACAACHAPMDGLGFALENYDAVGAWRERDGAWPVDASGELPGGVVLTGPEGLADHLLRSGAFTSGLARHLATYALGRALSPGDADEVAVLVHTLGPDPALDELVAGIVELPAFRRRHRREP